MNWLKPEVNGMAFEYQPNPNLSYNIIYFIIFLL